MFSPAQFHQDRGTPPGKQARQTRHATPRAGGAWSVIRCKVFRFREPHPHGIMTGPPEPSTAATTSSRANRHSSTPWLTTVVGRVRAARSASARCSREGRDSLPKPPSEVRLFPGSLPQAYRRIGRCLRISQGVCRFRTTSSERPKDNSRISEGNPPLAAFVAHLGRAMGRTASGSDWITPQFMHDKHLGKSRSGGLTKKGPRIKVGVLATATRLAGFGTSGI